MHNTFTQAWWLTSGADNFIGTSGNDTATAILDGTTTTSNTLSAADTINLGAGNDTLNLIYQGATVAGIPAATVSGVETLNVRAVGTGAVTGIDLNAILGVTAFNSDRSTQAVTVTNLATGASAGMFGNGSIANGDLTFGYKTTTDAAVLNLVGGTTAGNVAITSAPTAVTINSTGAANTIGTLNVGNSATALTINAATGLTSGVQTGAVLKTITVTGAAATAATPGTPAANDIVSAVQLGTLAATVTTIDASAMTAGGVSVALTTAITSFKGGAGNDTVTTAATTLQTASIIDAGAGTGDVLRVGAASDIDTATKAKTYANFEVLDSMATSASINLTLLTNSAITSERVGGDVNFAGMSAVQAAAVTVYATSTGTYGITGATGTGQIDTLKLTVDDGLVAKNLITLGNINAAGVELITITAVDNVTVTSLSGATSLTNLTATGAGNVNITTGALGVIANSKIDASAVTGTVTINAAAATGNGLDIVGSTTKANTLTGSAQADKLTGGSVVDTLKGLAGNDIIIASDGNDAITGGLGADTMTGGIGNDTFTIRPGDSYAYATPGTAEAITISPVASSSGGSYTVSTVINGITVTTAAIAQGAADTVITTAVKTAIAANVEASSYVTVGASSNTVVLTAVNGSNALNVTASVSAGNGTVGSAYTSSGSSSGVLTTDTIIGLELGGADATTAIDKINISGVTAAALTVVAAGTITGADLSAAVNALFNTGGALNGTNNTVGLYTFGTDTYLIGNVGGAGSAFGSATAITSAATLEATSDFIIKVTGVSGTLDASDFTFV